MKSTFIKYLVTLFIFLLIDALWLASMNGVYSKYIGHLMSPQPNLGLAGLFYLVFAFGIQYFAVSKGVESKSVKKALINGALFGFFTYATYDMTNAATLKDWPILITVVDIIWGTCVNAVSAGLATFILLKESKMPSISSTNEAV